MQVFQSYGALIQEEPHPVRDRHADSVTSKEAPAESCCMISSGSDAYVHNPILMLQVSFILKKLKPMTDVTRVYLLQ
jgi:hypothetical protein